MLTPTVSTIQEVYEQFRQDLVASLRAAGFKPPPEAELPGNCRAAAIAWVRLQDRSIPPAPREVHLSQELSTRQLSPAQRRALEQVSR